jgi:hypothetical protein
MARLARHVDERQHQLAVERLHNGVVAPPVELERQTRHHRLAGDPMAPQLDPPKAAALHQGDPAVPVALALVGEEVEVHLHAPGELLVEPLPVMRREVVDERDTTPHAAADASGTRSGRA